MKNWLHLKMNLKLKFLTNSAYLPQKVLLVFTDLAARQINAIRWVGGHARQRSQGGG